MSDLMNEVSVIPRGQPLSNSEGNVFRIDAPDDWARRGSGSFLKLQWTSSSKLSVEYPVNVDVVKMQHVVTIMVGAERQEIKVSYVAGKPLSKPPGGTADESEQSDAVDRWATGIVKTASDKVFQPCRSNKAGLARWDEDHDVCR